MLVAVFFWKTNAMIDALVVAITVTVTVTVNPFFQVICAAISLVFLFSPPFILLLALLLLRLFVYDLSMIVSFCDVISFLFIPKRWVLKIYLLSMMWLEFLFCFWK